jgi:hypothetical protein
MVDGRDVGGPMLLRTGRVGGHDGSQLLLVRI